ncbi:hypothetical protein OsJ_35483 [Oryza sativa Japonica Group]|uniref:Uncharacterized protein n=1 Tax=Oryza sativa subsp. japonica TaxID=39947 RepID=B9GC89_ORYSJ|nr:hypothetical protein OsJ_35483 [Oryza sativa Japonica Group]
MYRNGGSRCREKQLPPAGEAAAAVGRSSCRPLEKQQPLLPQQPPPLPLLLREGADAAAWGRSRRPHRKSRCCLRKMPPHEWERIGAESSDWRFRWY